MTSKPRTPAKPPETPKARNPFEGLDDQTAADHSARNESAAEIEKALNAQGVPVGNPSVSPDRVGALSEADKEASGPVAVSDPRANDKAQSEKDKALKQKMRDLGHADWEPPVRCKVAGCQLPEFVEQAGLCGPHWALYPEKRPQGVRTTEAKGGGK